MPNPFSSDYVSTSVTEIAPASPAPGVKAATAPTGGAVPHSAEGAEPKAYGFEPQRYGLGKPRRIVIRGKIAIE